MYRSEVIKSSAAIQITNRVSLLQRRAWNVLLAFAYDALLTADTHTMRVSELIEWLSISSNNTEHLRDVLLGLRREEVEWNVLGKDGGQVWGNAALLADVEIRQGVIEYSFGGILRKKLHNPAVYARIKLSIQNKFGSKYALALYELLVDYLRIGHTGWIDLDDFRKLMGLEPSDYPEFKILNRNIIKSALDEINHVSDVTGSVEYRREARRVVAVKFFVKPKEQLKNKLPEVLPLAPADTPPHLAFEESDHDAFDLYLAGMSEAELKALETAAAARIRRKGRTLSSRTQERMIRAEIHRQWKEQAPATTAG